MVSDKSQDRKPLYYLDPGEEILSGIFVNENGYIKRYTKRLSGTTIPASANDTYQEKYVNHDESEVLFQGSGPLTIEDFSIGKGYVTITPDAGFPGLCHGAAWILWSCIYIVAN